MTDRLTDDEMAAIAARVEAVHKFKVRTGLTSIEATQELAADVPRLLAHIRAQDAELARLRDALAALVDEGTGAYVHDWDYRPACNYCHYVWRTDQQEEHRDDCPVAAARALLDAP